MTPKIGVSYEWQWGAESEWLAGSQEKDTIEVISHRFEGFDTIGVRSGSIVDEYRLANGELQALGYMAYRNEDMSGGIESKSVNTPFISIPNSKPGETKVIGNDYVETFYDTNGNVASSKTYALTNKFEFLGYEDVTLGDGTVLRNACKLKSTTLIGEQFPNSVGEYDIWWSYPGYMSVKNETYTSAGVKESHSFISKVIQAP